MAVCVENFSSFENSLDSTSELLSGIVDSNPDHTNNIGFLEVSQRGSLKLKGTFEGLKDFVESNQISTAKWTSPGGGTKLCETENLAIRWYSTTGSITLKGERASDAKNKLISIAENEKEASQKSSQRAITHNLHASSIDLTTPPPMGRTEDSVHSSGQSIIRRLTSSKLPWRAEIVNLKTENNDLRERNTNISYIMSDLRTKIKDVENEKRSLITALKLLQADSNSDLEKRCQDESGLGDETIQANPPSSDQPPNQPANKEKRRKKRKSKKSKPNVPDLTADHSTDVAAAPSEIAVSATSETATSATSEATVGPDRPDSMRHRKKTVVIAGDSIVKNIVGTKMSGNDSKHYFIVKPFPELSLTQLLILLLKRKRTRQTQQLCLRLNKTR
ncbi:Hypothetical predicted protein [Paramuricea clavata]|uniref:Uncharacterized protein n=1 Tax=Paramuricea clavata TaxID=317549 RepID=A0A6S7JL49_PARCT|nr:Hypothetical predicted protein [Paramuricea clavata]